MSKSKFQVPYQPDGSVPHYPEPWKHGELTWKDPEPFEATLTLDGMSRGRSAANFDFTSETGATFTVFMTDLVDMIRDRRWVEGRITATFVPCKRGQNYGIRLVTP